MTREERGIPDILCYWTLISQEIKKFEDSAQCEAFSCLDCSHNTDPQTRNLLERVAITYFREAAMCSKISDAIYHIFYPEVNDHE